MVTSILAKTLCYGLLFALSVVAQFPSPTVDPRVESTCLVAKESFYSPYIKVYSNSEILYDPSRIVSVYTKSYTYTTLTTTQYATVWVEGGPEQTLTHSRVDSIAFESVKQTTTYNDHGRAPGNAPMQPLVYTSIMPSAPAFNPADECCPSNGCAIEATSVGVIYLAPENATAGLDAAVSSYQPRTLISDDYTFMSPSIYIAYTSLKAIATCVNGEKLRGKTYDSTTIAYEPDAIKIGCGWAGPSSPININDFYNQPNNSYMETHGNCQSIAMLMESGAEYSTVAVSTAGDSPEWRSGTGLAASHQVFSLPADLGTVDPAWSTCTPVYRGAWDPPRVLTSVAAVGPTTTTAPISTVAPSPVISISPQLPTATQSTVDPEDSIPLPVFGLLHVSATQIAKSSSSSSSVKISKPEHHDQSALRSEDNKSSDSSVSQPTSSKNIQETPSFTVSTYIDPITSSHLHDPILDPTTDTQASSDAHLSSKALHTHVSSHSEKKASSETATKSPDTLILQQTTDAHDNSRGSGVITKQSSKSIISGHVSQTAETDHNSATSQITTSPINWSSHLALTPSKVSSGTKIVFPGNSSPEIEQTSSRSEVSSSAPTLESSSRTSKTEVTPYLPTEQSALVTGEHNSGSMLGISSQVTSGSSAVNTAPASEESSQDPVDMSSSVERGTTTAVPETESAKKSTIFISPIPASASPTDDLTSNPPSSDLASSSIDRDSASSILPSGPTFSSGAVRSMSAFKPSAVASAIIYDTASMDGRTSESLTATPGEATMGGLASLMLSVFGNPHESPKGVSTLLASDSLPSIVYATKTMSSVPVSTTAQEVVVDISGTAATGLTRYHLLLVEILAAKLQPTNHLTSVRFPQVLHPQSGLQARLLGLIAIGLCSLSSLL